MPRTGRIVDADAVVLRYRGMADASADELADELYQLVAEDGLFRRHLVRPLRFFDCNNVTQWRDLSALELLGDIKYEF